MAFRALHPMFPLFGDNRILNWGRGVKWNVGADLSRLSQDVTDFAKNRLRLLMVAKTKIGEYLCRSGTPGGI